VIVEQVPSAVVKSFTLLDPTQKDSVSRTCALTVNNAVVAEAATPVSIEVERAFDV